MFFNNLKRKISTGHIGKQDSFTSSDESVVKGSSWECGDKGDIVKGSSWECGDKEDIVSNSMDEFSEKFQTAFDPHPPFLENFVAIFFFHVQKALF